MVGLPRPLIRSIRFPASRETSASYTNFACELYTALEFTQAGLYTMVVNSDDCFATTSGPNPLDTFGAAQLGRFDAAGGRGSADTSFQLFVQTPGLYGFRTVYQQGTGGGNLEWFMVNDNGDRVLINDTTNAIPALSVAAHHHRRLRHIPHARRQ